jgi:acyl-[acyl-carrier-protein]-phospholipid O-acyltransferase/long-chain-fatty-acid--[acyl-carrier-protein] ligase
LIGTLAGGLVARRGGDPAHFAGAMIFISLACYGASRFIPPTGEAAPELRIDANIFRSTRHLLADLRADRNLWRAGVMVSLFWMFGAIALSLLPPAVKLRLGGDEAAVSLFLALFAVAVALGSGLGAALCRDRIRLWPTPFATALIGLAAADLGWALQETAPARGFADFIADPVVWRVGVDFALMAAAGGVLAVPSFASAQAWAPADKRARVIAAINVLNAAFMVTGALAVALLQASGLGAAGVFGALAPACWLAALWMRGHLPDDPSRD